MKKLSGWTTAMIADVATIGGGSGFPDAYQGNSNGDFPFIKVSDMNSPGNEKYVVTANNWISEEVRKKIKMIGLLQVQITEISKQNRLQETLSKMMHL